MNGTEFRDVRFRIACRRGVIFLRFLGEWRQPVPSRVTCASLCSFDAKNNTPLLQASVIGVLTTYKRNLEASVGNGTDGVFRGTTRGAPLFPFGAEGKKVRKFRTY